MARYSTSCPSLLRLLYSHQKTTCSMSMKWDETVTISRVLLSSNNIALSCLGRGIVDVLRIGERIKSTTRTWSIWITKGIITRHIVWQHRRSWCRRPSWRSWRCSFRSWPLMLYKLHDHRMVTSTYMMPNAKGVISANTKMIILFLTGHRTDI